MTEQELLRREAMIEKRMAEEEKRNAVVAAALKERHAKQRANAAHQRMVNAIVIGAV